MTNTLEQWAIKHGVGWNALVDLKAMWGNVETVEDIPLYGKKATEAQVQNAVRLEAAKANCKLMRNNVGALPDQTGRWVRYGLCNDSKKMNAQLKSHDLIGIKKVLIKPEHVGTVIGQFISREIKKEGWIYSNTPHEQAQARFAKMIVAYGGDAQFASSVGTINVDT
jgi:hypothetical protein